MAHSQIRDATRATQLVLFDGLRFGRSIVPTDIDGLVEFGGKLFIVFELKYHVATLGDSIETLMSGAQEKCLVRVCTILSTAAPTLLVEAHHEYDSACAVDAAETLVHRYWFGKPGTDGRWHTPSVPTSLRGLMLAAVRRYAQECMP